MDDDATELAELRRRAYGPDADIASDPTALARLVRLEDEARATAAPTLISDEPASLADSASGSAPPPAPAHRRRPRWHTMMVIGVAVTALCLAAAGSRSASGITAPDAAATAAPDPFGDSSPFHADPAARVLAYVPTDDALGALGREHPPSFPIPEDLLWSSMLGTHYGWELWLARSRSGFPCVGLVRAGEPLRARCVLPARYDDGSLVVTIPFDLVPASERPPGMQPTESLGFEWMTDSSVYIVVGQAGPATTP